ncbi:hypothetical protein AGMMS50212_01600 [Spirochaetia bacterium]|nr:hypothetical protein AGMMS50212_01600 [Spirochaetia bacterium]
METITAANAVGEAEVCSQVLKAEIELLTKIAAAQTLVENAVKDKEWVNFGTLIEDMGRLAEQENELEQRRVELFNKFEKGGGSFLGQSGSTRFYAFVMRFPHDERRVLTDLYRSLKMLAAKIQFTNDALSNYLNEQRLLISGVIETIYPERKGNFYGRQGTLKTADMRSLVLNKQL